MDYTQINDRVLENLLDHTYEKIFQKVKKILGLEMDVERVKICALMYSKVSIQLAISVLADKDHDTGCTIKFQLADSLHSLALKKLMQLRPAYLERAKEYLLSVKKLMHLSDLKLRHLLKPVAMSNLRGIDDEIRHCQKVLSMLVEERNEAVNYVSEQEASLLSGVQHRFSFAEGSMNDAH